MDLAVLTWMCNENITELYNTKIDKEALIQTTGLSVHSA